MEDLFAILTLSTSNVSDDETGTVSMIMVVSLALAAMMKDQVEQLKWYYMCMTKIASFLSEPF